jgi:hypothetical protein
VLLTTGGIGFGACCVGVQMAQVPQIALNGGVAPPPLTRGMFQSACVLTGIKGSTAAMFML